MNKYRANGFTLIELMIAVAIIAILSSLAVPAYQKYVQKSRRSDAINALTKAAAQEEKYYFQNNVYGDNAAAAILTASAEGYYTITAATTNGGQGYTLTAVPTGVQAGDADCQSFTLNNLGEQGSAPGNKATCWHH